MPYQLTSTQPQVKNIILVLYGKTITGAIGVSENAPHIGLLIGDRFADYQMFGSKVGDYSAYYSAPWYYDTRIACQPTAAQLKDIAALSQKWGKYINAKENAGNHSKWPCNCRSYVAYIITAILNQTASKLPGLGNEVEDANKVAALTAFATSL